jgi:CRISPR-associated protein Cmr2
MSHLLAVTIGPVQEFIAAARRTRDLWFGSYLLSEISRATAKSVERQGGKLIFPASTDAENVANVILAEMNTGDPKLAAAEAREAAQVRWLEFAADARSAASGVIRADAWDDQVAGVIEFYAAWVPQSDSYQRDRTRVMRLLAGRKNCRNFKQAEFNDRGLPKSSLDGQRPTVLEGPKPGESRETYRRNWPEKLRLSSGEQLDVIGVTKRLGKKPGDSDPRYPSVARVAAETWLQGVRTRHEFHRLKAACQKLVAKGLNTVREEKYQYFPYEGTVICKDRHPDLKNELGLADNDFAEVAAALKDIGGEPSPFLAILVADGDSMGAKLSALSRIEAHQALSGKLAEFASHAHGIVRDQDGVPIYVGGDDVLALLPVHRCLKCARGLRNDFNKRTGMTLSAGIAIGHFMENLEDLRAYGQSAEKAAKSVDGKDALAVHLHKRGSAPVSISGHWESGLDERIEKLAHLVNQGIIPSKLPYELRAMARLYENWVDAEQAEAAIKIDLVRLIARKQSKGVETVREALKQETQGMNARKLLTFAEELLIARQFAAAFRQGGEAAK